MGGVISTHGLDGTMLTRIRKGLCVVLMLLPCLTAQAGKVTYVYTDPQGTPLAEADASGTIIATFDYKPYGTQSSGSPAAGPGYAGHVNDPDIGLVYMQERYYDPALGRFLSVDSLGFADNFNRFSYAGNNPIKNFDPDGADCSGNGDSGDDCHDDGKSDQQPPPPPPPPQNQNQPAAAITLAPVIVGANSTITPIIIRGAWMTAGRALAAAGPYALAVTLYIADANSVHDSIYGRQGCYGAVYCGGLIVVSSKPLKVPVPKLSGKEGSKDAPSWAKGQRPYVGESGKDFADRLFGDRYGRPPSAADKGAGGEWSQIKKWGDRSFKDP